jgi:hypothetical protein
VTDKSEIVGRLEGMGANQVQVQLMAGQLPGSWNPVIREWLAEKDAADRLRREAAEREQMKTIKSGTMAAWIAAVASVAAAILALAALVVALLPGPHR